MDLTYTQSELATQARKHKSTTAALTVDDALWIWLPEAQYWYQFEGAVEGFCISHTEMVETHLPEHLDGEALASARNRAGLALVRV